MNICSQRLKEIIVDAKKNSNACPFGIIQGDCKERVSFMRDVKSNAFILNVFQELSGELNLNNNPIVPFKDVITKRHGQNTPHRFEGESCDHCVDNIRAIASSVKNIIKRSFGCDLSSLGLIGEDKKG